MDMIDMSGETTIGLFRDFNDTYTITVNGLIKEIEFSNKTTNDYFKLPWGWKQFCDFRYNTCLQRFIYDPFTGEKIDWKELKNNYAKYAKRTNKQAD